MILHGWPRGIAAITLFVEDLDAAKDFYQRAFGVSQSYEDADSAVYQFGETLINLLTTSAAPELIEPARVAEPAAGSRFQLTLHVEDVDDVCDHLTARGVPLLNGPTDRPWGPRTASFQDPAGHIWEIAS